MAKRACLCLENGQYVQIHEAILVFPLCSVTQIHTRVHKLSNSHTRKAGKKGTAFNNPEKNLHSLLGKTVQARGCKLLADRFSRLPYRSIFCCAASAHVQMHTTQKVPQHRAALWNPFRDQTFDV